MSRSSNISRKDLIIMTIIMITGFACAFYIYKEDPQAFFSSFKIIGPSARMSLLPLELI